RLPPPPSSTLFPYTTLFRSVQIADGVSRAPAGVRDAGTGVRAKGAGASNRSRVPVRRSLAGLDRLLRVARSRRQRPRPAYISGRSEEHTSELQSRFDLVCRL